MPNLKDLTIYLNALKICNLIHQNIFSEKHSIEIPSMLSENIVKSTLKLANFISPDENDDKLYDAQKTVGDITQYYEIKATSSVKGTTTINLGIRAHVLVWAFFDFNQNIIVIKQIDGFDKKKTLEDVILEDRIKSIKRNRKDNKVHTKDEEFLEVFKPGNDNRTTVTLDNFKWDNDKTIELSMDNLKTIDKK
jgi:hypothetical protein